MYEEEFTHQPYIPWKVFDELRNEGNCRYGNVETWSRIRSRISARFFGKVELPDPTPVGVSREIERSRFGDVLVYLAKKKISNGMTPTPSLIRNTVPKTHHIRINGNEEHIRDSQHTPLYGGGASYHSFTEALSKSIGELLERHVLATPFFNQKNKIIRRTFGDTKIPPALLHEIPRFFDWQKKYVPNGLTSGVLKKKEIKNTPVHCIEGQSLSTGKKISLPLQHVQWGLPYSGTYGPDPYIFSPRTTNGAGGGFSLTEAALSGICELIERDGFLIYWLNRLSPRQICIDQHNSGKLSQRFLEIYGSLLDRGYEIYFLDTTSDIRVPSATCLIRTPLTDGRISISVTGKCHPDPHHVLEGALLEHIAFLSSPYKELPLFVFDEERAAFSDRNIGKDERVNLWRSGKIANKILFFLSGEKISFEQWASGFPSIPSNHKAALTRVLSEFIRMEKESGRAYEVFCHEASNPVLGDLNYHVVKVIIPALMPLYLRESDALLDCVRLREVPGKLGYTAVPIDAYNPIPHPFP